MSRRQEKKKHRKLKAAAAAAVVAAGVSVNQAFDPEELIRPADEPVPAHHRETVPTPEGDDVVASWTEETRLGRADRLRQRFLRLPVAVKAVTLLPLWAVGALPAALLTAGAPLWHMLLDLGLQAGVLLAVFCGVYKLLFPKAKLRELFRRKNLKWLFLGALTLTVVNVLLAQLWAGWPLLRAVLLLAAGFRVLCLLWRRLCGALKGPEPARVRTELKMEY